MRDAFRTQKNGSPAALLELAVGYQKSQTLFAFAELGLADLLAEKEATAAAEIAARLALDPLAAEKFLNACAAVGIVEKTAEGFANSPLAAEFLTRAGGKYLGGQMKRYQNRSYAQWADLTGHLRRWRPGAGADAAPETEDQGAEAMAEQHNLALLHGRALADSYDFSGVRRLLDVGGGTGAMSIGLCERLPHLRAVVFDLPANVARAREMVARAGLADRIECVAGDAAADALPADFDAALLANLLAVFDPPTNVALFAKLYERLPAGGALLVSGWILDESRTAPGISALFCLEDICWNAPDVERAFTTYREWLAAAGFEEVKVETYFAPTKLITARKR